MSTEAQAPASSKGFFSGVLDSAQENVSAVGASVSNAAADLTTTVKDAAAKVVATGSPAELEAKRLADEARLAKDEEARLAAEEKARLAKDEEARLAEEAKEEAGGGRRRRRSQKQRGGSKRRRSNSGGSRRRRNRKGKKSRRVERH